MSRSGYSDDCDGAELNLWRGAVNAAIKGKRGQALLRELAEALDAMPVKELISGELQADGQFCALGVVGAARGIDLDRGRDMEREVIASMFDIAPALAAEVMYINDDDYAYWGRWGRDNPMPTTAEEVAALERKGREKRWRDVRAWVAENIKEQA